MVNGIGHESPAVGVSGSKPLVNGDLRDGEKEDDYAIGGTVPATDGVGESITATGKAEVVVKVRSARERVYACWYYLIVAGELRVAFSVAVSVGACVGDGLPVEGLQMEGIAQSLAVPGNGTASFSVVLTSLGTVGGEGGRIASGYI